MKLILKALVGFTGVWWLWKLFLRVISDVASNYTHSLVNRSVDWLIAIIKNRILH